MDIRDHELSERTNEQTTATDGKIAYKLLIKGGYALAGYLVGTTVLPFGASPFGFALLAASGKHTLSVFLGLCVSLFGVDEPMVLLGAYVLTLALRALLTVTTNSSSEAVKKNATLGEFIEGLFCEHISLRIISASVGAFAVGLYRMFIGGFLYYDLFGSIVAIVAAAFGTALWYALPLLQNRRKRQSTAQTVWESAALIGFACAVAYGLRDNVFYGISLSSFAAMLAVLLATRKRGIAFGSLLAILAGLSVSVTYAPLFVFSAVAYGFLFHVSPLLGSFSAFVVGMGWGLYTDGVASLTSLLPALLLANFLFFTFEKLFISDSEASDAAEEANKESHATVSYVPNGADIAVARLDDTARRIKTLCEGLSSLSEMLLFTEACRAKDASASEVCRSALASGELAFEIGEMGTVSDVLDSVDYASAYMADSVRTEAVALDYRALSDYLSNIMVVNEKEYTADTALGKRIAMALADKVSDVNWRVSVFGEHRPRVIISADDARMLEKNLARIRTTVIEESGFSADDGEMMEIGEQTYLTFCRRTVLDAAWAGRKRCAHGESEYCGDSFGVIRAQDNGKMFAFISDGMGSGREAAVTSGLCTLFLQKLLPINMYAGDGVGATLEMLNSFLRSRNGAGVRESLATVDLGVFDFVEQKVTFYKSGAAPTYVFRDGSLFKLRSRTVPIGIVKDLDAGKINMELLPGDTIVMVSDGVTQGREECPELFELLRSRLLTHTADELADAVVAYADERGCSDDVSVVVVKISENDKIMKDVA